MATPIRIKRSAVSGKRPQLTDLQVGELALNTYDGSLFTERDTGGVGIATTVSNLTPWTESFGASSISYLNSVGIGTDNPQATLDVNGRIVGAATSSVIPFFYSSLSDLPSAVTYHGAFAHVHATGKGYFAHAGNWIELVNKDVTGGLNITDNLSVSGVSTFSDGLFVPDDKRIRFGNTSASPDFQIYHDGSHNILNASNGFIKLYNNVFQVYNQSGGNIAFEVVPETFTKLFYGSSQRLLTTVSGVDITGTLNVTGISTFTGAIDANGDLDVDGRIVGAATSNVIPFLYSNYSDLPSPATYHGAFAHVHATGKGYFAHAGNWMELVNKETNGTVSIGNLESVDGIFSGNVSIAGTLTYEDVTNIDAVGLITARSGIHVVGGGVSIAADGLNVSGISTFNDDVNFTGTHYNAFWDKSLSALRFNDAAAIRLGLHQDLQIDHDGNNSKIVHIGTGNLKITAQSGIIDVTGDVSITGVSTFNDNVTIGNAAGISANANADNLVLGESTGNHGITILSGQSAVGNLFFGDSTNSSPAGIQYFHTDNHMEFRVAGGEKVRFTSGGFVGIGTEAPSHKLEVNGGSSLKGDLNVTGISTFTDQVGFGTHIKLQDYARIQLGEKSGGDFFIGHNPTLYGAVYNELISTNGNILLENRDTGANQYLYLKSDQVSIRSYTGNEAFITCSLNSTVKLWYDNVEKLETTNTGIRLYQDLTVDRNALITGVSTFSDDIHIKGDGKQIFVGADDDLEINHNGSDTTIKDHTGGIYLKSQNIHMRGRNDNVDMAQFYRGDGVYLRFNGSNKFATTGYGVTISGTTETQQLNVSGVSTFGSSGQAVISDNGNITATAITISDGQPGLFFVDTGADPDFVIQNRNGTFAIRDTTSNVNRFLVNAANGDATVTGGLDVDGTLKVGTGVTALTNGNVSIGGTFEIFESSGIANRNFSEFKLSTFSIGQHNNVGTMKIMNNNNTGTLLIGAGGGGGYGGISLFNKNLNARYLQAHNEGAVDLYYDGDLRFATTGVGATIFGNTETQTLNVTGVSTFTGNTELDDVNVSGDLSVAEKIVHSGDTDSYIKFTDNQIDIQTNAQNKVRIGAGASVGIHDDAFRAVVIGTGNQNNVLIRPNSGASNNMGNSDAVNNLVVMRVPYGENPASQTNAGMRVGMMMRLFNNDAGFGDIDPTKSAAFYAVSEDPTKGYSRVVGLSFYTSAFNSSQTEKLRISGTGNVGIGTTLPKQTLEVFSGSAGRPTFRHTGGFGGLQIAGPQPGSGAALMFARSYDVVGGGLTAYSIQMAGNTQGLHFISGDPSESSTKTRLFLSSAGSIGINTSNPRKKLHLDNGTMFIRGDVAPQIRLNADINDASSTRFAFGLATGANNFFNGAQALDGCVAAPSTGRLLLGVGVTPRMYIINSGDITIARNTQLGNAKLSLQCDSGPEEGIAVNLNQSSGISTAFAIWNNTGSEVFNLAQDTDTTPDLIFKIKGSGESAPVEKLRIADDGKVGIGTDNPTQKVQINNGVDDPNIVLLYGADTSTEYAGIGVFQGNATFTGGGIGSNDTGISLRTASGGTEIERVRIDSSGRVLVGTTTEGHANADDLTIATSGDTGITIRSGTTHNGRIYFSDANSGAGEYAGALDYDHNDNKFSIFTDSGERFRIDSSGRVLLGTQTEGHPNADDLTIATSGDTGITIRSGTSNNGRIYFSDATSGTGEVVGSLDYDHNVDSFSILTGNELRLRINGDGNVGINSGLDVAGISTLGSGGLGQAVLQYQGSTKLQTQTWGVQVPQTLVTQNFLKTQNISSSTEGKSIFLVNLAGNLLEIGHTSNNSFITGHVGNISINAPQVSISTHLSVSGVATATSFESTVSTGTAPFVVASTTKVTNLNADLLDGKSTANSKVGNTVVTRNAAGGFSAGDVTFDNVSIGGTLTYEDVTNIDSLGIITARSDIHVGAGISVVGVGSFGSVAIGTGPVLERGTQADDGALKITTDFGYLEIGPANSGYSHFYTDRTRYYFNRRIVVDEGIISSYNEDLVLQTNQNDERLRIKNDTGNVGIGTNDPGAQLEIYRNSAALGHQLRIEEDGTGDAVMGFALTGTRAYTLGIDNSDSDKFKLATGSDLHTDTLVTVTTGGNVGIGTNNPLSLLSLYSDADGEELLHFDMGSAADRRGWKFKQGETGTATQLVLQADENGKVFQIKNSSGDEQFYLYTAASGSYLRLVSELHINDTILHVGDQDTKIRFPAADTISFETAGDERLRIASDGKVGIGTDGPEGTLHISGGDDGDCVLIIEADEDNATSENDNPYILFRQDGGVDMSAVGNNPHSVSDENNALVLSNSVSTLGGIIFKTGTTNGYTNAEEALRIASDGNIGIGTASPETNLTIAKNATNQTVATIPTVRLTNLDTTAVATDIVGSYEFFSKDVHSNDKVTGFMRNTPTDAGVNYDLTFGTIKTSDSNAVERLRITSEGKVGINSTSPQAYLDIEGDGVLAKFGSTDSTVEALYIKNNVASYPAITNESSPDTIELRSAGSVQATIDYNSNDTNKYFRVVANGQGGGGTEVFRVQEDGDVGIGTINPVGARLRVQKDGLSETLQQWGGSLGSTGPRFMQLFSPSTDSSSDYFRFQTGNAFKFQVDSIDALCIKSDGTIAIGTDAPRDALSISKPGASNVSLRIHDPTADTYGGHFSFFENDSDGNTANEIWIGGVLNNSKRGVIKIYRDAVENAMYINTNSFVGIGTSVPASRLDVYDPSGLGIISRSATTQATNTNKALKVRNNSTTDTFNVSYKGQGYFAGNLGIGTASPDAELHVRGQIKVDDANYARVEYARDDTNLWSVGLRDTDDFWFFRESGSANVIFQHGNIGINSANPDAPLTLYTDASAAWKFRINTSVSDGAGFYQRSNGDFEMVLRDASNNNNYIAGTSGALQFTTSGSEKLRITGIGSVGIGITNPGALLDIGGNTDGNIQAIMTRGADTSFQIQFRNESSSNSATAPVGMFGVFRNDVDIVGMQFRRGSGIGPGSLSFTTGGDERIRIQSDGDVEFKSKVGIGTDTPINPLHVVQKTTDAYGTGIARFEYYDTDDNTGDQHYDAKFIPTGTYIKSFVTGSGTDFLIVDADNTAGRASFAVESAGGTERFRVDSNGNVGINTTLPAAKLDVRGDINFQNNALITNDGGTSNIDHIWHSDASNYGRGGTWNFVSDGAYKGAGQSVIQIGYLANAGGGHFLSDVGVGTTDPLAKLHVDNHNSPSETGGILVQNVNYANNQDKPYLIVGSQNWTGATSNWGTYGFHHRIKTNSGGSPRVTIDNLDAEIICFHNSQNVGINTSEPTAKLQVVGSFAATTKSFLIDHPTKEGMKLRHGSLEGPEHAVYVRGRLKDNNTIELPDYWTGLVDENTITVNLTPIGSESTLHKVVDICDNTVVVGSEDGNINCFYTVFGERKDVEKMEVEY